MAAQKLTAQANEWLADNDQTDREAEKDPITEDVYKRQPYSTQDMMLVAISTIPSRKKITRLEPRP